MTGLKDRVSHNTTADGMHHTHTHTLTHTHPSSLKCQQLVTPDFLFLKTLTSGWIKNEHSEYGEVDRDLYPRQRWKNPLTPR